MALKSELEENPYALPIPEEQPDDADEYRDSFETEEEFQEALAAWPRCPQCGRRRITRCPVCKTSGTLFPLGDPSFWDGRADDRPPTRQSTRCSQCGDNVNRHDNALYDESERVATLDGEIMPGLPSPRYLAKLQEKTSDVFGGLDEKKPEESQQSETPTVWETTTQRARDFFISINANPEVPETPEIADPNALVAICNVCSEAFEPKFPKCCEWCGYDFAPDAEPEDENGDDQNGVGEFLARKELDEINEDEEANYGRVIFSIVALAIVLGAMLLYLSTL